PRPSEPSSVGRAQQEAAPNAAARPPAARNVEPATLAGLSSGKPVRVLSVIAGGAPGRVVKIYNLCSRYRLKASDERKTPDGRTCGDPDRRAVEAGRMQHRDDPLLRADRLAAGAGTQPRTLPALRCRRCSAAGLRAPG